MQQLDNFCEIAKAFSSDEELVEKINEASKTLKESLLKAVKELHPEHVFEVPEEKSKHCASFLSDYLKEGSNIFSTNYDILLYWVLMRNKIEKSVDGFGRDVEDTGEYVPEENLEFSELRWGKHKQRQNIHYLHGALPLLIRVLK